MTRCARALGPFAGWLLLLAGLLLSLHRRRHYILGPFFCLSLFLPFARLGMASSSFGSSTSGWSSSSRFRSVLRCFGFLPSETLKLVSPFLVVSWLGFCPRRPNSGFPFSLRFGLCLLCFLSVGPSPHAGACVCAESQTYPGTTFQFMQGDHPFGVCDDPTKRPQQMRISRLITSTYLHNIVLSLCLSSPLLHDLHECTKPPLGY